jgi:hypothetical protein
MSACPSLLWARSSPPPCSEALEKNMEVEKEEEKKKASQTP